MSIAEEIPFSHLIQHSRDTIARLESSHGRQLRLVRRDGEDLVLESARRAEADAQGALTAARLISEMLRSDETAAPLIKVLPAVFPWLRFLPDAAAREFATEFAETSLAAAEVGNLAPVVPVVEAWRATAEIHADPALHKALTVPLDAAECSVAMAAERRRVFRRIHELAAGGDETAAYLAEEFSRPEQLLGGDEGGQAQ